MQVSANLRDKHATLTNLMADTAQYFILLQGDVVRTWGKKRKLCMRRKKSAPEMRFDESRRNLV